MTPAERLGATAPCESMRAVKSVPLPTQRRRSKNAAGVAASVSTIMDKIAGKIDPARGLDPLPLFMWATSHGPSSGKRSRPTLRRLPMSSALTLRQNPTVGRKGLPSSPWRHHMMLNLRSRAFMERISKGVGSSCGRLRSHPMLLNQGARAAAKVAVHCSTVSLKKRRTAIRTRAARGATVGLSLHSRIVSASAAFTRHAIDERYNTSDYTLTDCLLGVNKCSC